MTVEQPSFLLVDDSPVDLGLIESALRKVGVTRSIVSKPSGEDARNYLVEAAKANRRPGVLITDLKMFGMDGIELIRWVRSQPSLDGLLVVMLSGSVLDDDMTRAYEAGTDVYLTKPLQFSDQVETLRGLVRWITVSQGFTGSEDGPRSQCEIS